MNEEMAFYYLRGPVLSMATFLFYSWVADLISTFYFFETFIDSALFVAEDELELLIFLSPTPQY